MDKISKNFPLWGISQITFTHPKRCNTISPVEVLEELIERQKRFKKLLVTPCRGIEREVSISGAKNSTLPLLAASLLVEDLTLENFPFLLDTLYGLKILKLLGKEVEIYPDLKRVRIYGNITSTRVPYELSSLFRGSILFLGGLLGAVGKATVSHPGGCSIGSRPIDQHLKFVEHLGAGIDFEGGYISVNLKARAKRGDFTFDLITVTGTENALLALAGVEGEHTLHNVALEPEVLDLVNFLRKVGVEVETDGRSMRIKVPPKGDLKKKLTYRVIPDRIEAGTFLVIGALLGEPLRVKGLNVDHLGAVLDKLTQSGARVSILSPSEVEVYRAETLRGLFIETAPYPGFPTDMQAQFMSMLSVADGSSVIVERIFENRFQHAMELSRMGAKISVKGNTAFIEGVDRLKGAPVKATDLRASASLVIAGLIAEGETVIENIGHLLRGYEEMDRKLQKLGCDVELV